MENVVYLPNGQWVLEKGAMNRLAPNTQGEEHICISCSYNVSTDKGLQIRGQRKLVQQHMDNKAAFKNIDGKTHIMLHRGIRDYEANKCVDGGSMNISDTHISHQEHGMYSDNYNYASGFADEGGSPHSVWTPIENINRNAHYECNAWQKRQKSNTLPDKEKKFYGYCDEGTPDKLFERYVDPECDCYHQVQSKGNHILVNPGKYQRATGDEVKEYLKSHKKDFKSNESAVKKKIKRKYSG